MDGTVFSDDFAEVAPPAREDSEVNLLPGKLPSIFMLSLFFHPIHLLSLSLLSDSYPSS